MGDKQMEGRGEREMYLKRNSDPKQAVLGF